jgi:hypothetical protein
MRTENEDRLTVTSRTGEVYETTEELTVGCIVCRETIPAQETVIIWFQGPAGWLVAHVGCARARLARFAS